MFVMQFGIRICLYTENPGTDPDPDADPGDKKLTESIKNAA